MKVLQYCQHVLGIGHFFRSMAIASAFEGDDVLFVEGGEPVAGVETPPHVRRLLLPPLMMDAAFSRIEAEDPDAVFSRRRAVLLPAARAFSPDVLLIEMYPFGRKRFGVELAPLVAETRAGGGSVVCSLRDILVEKERPEVYQARVLAVLQRDFDLVLVHSDPRVSRLDETFPRAPEIAVPVRYTGFVARPAPPRAPGGPGPLIAASAGGGRVGADLLAATIRAVSLIEDAALRLRVYLGPFTEGADRARLHGLASGDPRVALLPFARDFPAELAASDLSVSQAGYNTCMDVLSSGVRALVHPFAQNREQRLRAERLEGLGALRIVADLHPRALAAQILFALSGPPPRPAFPIEMDGAQKTALYARRLRALG